MEGFERRDNELLPMEEVSTQSISVEETVEFPYVIGQTFTPFIAWKIFGMLDKNAMLKCRTVSKTWRDSVDYRTNLWGLISPHSYQDAAKHGLVSICKLIIANADDKNPKGKRDLTPLHQAAGNGHLNICRLILDHVEVKNPCDVIGITPLHWAASEGHLEVYKLIMECVTDKNPTSGRGLTPLHQAAHNEHLEMCELILDNLDYKNPTDENGNTPLHAAALTGNLNIFELFMVTRKY